MNVMIKEVKYDRNVIELDKAGILSWKNSKIAKFDDKYDNPQKTTKKELLTNIEIKKHEELFVGHVRGIGKLKVCKIKGQWFSLRDIKSIIPKEFFIYDISDDMFLKISDLEKENYLIIASFFL